MAEKLTYEELEYQVKVLSREGIWRRQAVRALEESEEKYRLHFENAFDIIFSIDHNYRIISISPSVERILEYKPEELMGKPFQELKIFPPEYLSKILSDTKRILAGNRIASSEYEFIAKNGTRKFCEVSGAPMVRDGKVVATVSVARDITERLRAERSLEAANRSINEFVTRVSHGIRSPMNAVMGMADLLRETPLVAEQKKFLETIRSSAKNILQIANDILDLSKVEAGQINLKKASFDLMEVLKNTCETQAFLAQEKDLELVWWIDPNTETHLFGDWVRLDQVLSNLIGNAIMFTEKGDIFIEVKPQEGIQQQKVKDADPDSKREAGRPVELLFSVTDTGIGISRKIRQTIFNRFMQADSSITRKYGGTGLGLEISRGLVELMDGRIWVESKVGHGSTFFFTALLEVQSDKKDVQTPEMDLTGVKILIIDDNPKSCMVLSRSLSTWGALVKEKESGNQGLAEIKRAMETGDPYNLILLDSRMPGMDGFQMAKTIKKNSELTSPVIMMLDLNNMKSGKIKGKKLGITDFLLKPVSPSDLEDAVMVAFGRKKTTTRRRTEVTKPVAKEKLKPLHILLADNDLTNQVLIQAFLKNTPYKIDIAENGEIALKKFKTGNYHLVLMDIEMPVMDGYTATKEIRKWEKEKRLKETSILALTAHALVKHTQKSFEAGCNAFLAKPIKKTDLLAAIRKYTLLVEG